MAGKSVFKRLETDQEFRARIALHTVFKALNITTQLMIITADGVNLDNYALGHLSIQRRIIDDWT